MKNNKLKNLRINLGKNQKEVANDIGITQEYLSLIENNKRVPSLNLAIKFSNYYKVSLDEFK